MQGLKSKTMALTLTAILGLAIGCHAQMGAMNGRSDTGGMMGNGMMKDMMPIHSLLINHNMITRTVVDIPGGVRTVTTSRDPEIAKTIRIHVWAMKTRITKDEPIRQMDPLFQQLFLHTHEINLQIQDITGGVQATETSTNPQVTLLIRQHAHRAVSEFVKYGMPRMMQPTPLPKGYRPGHSKAGNGMMDM